MWPLNASNTGTETVKGPKLMAEIGMAIIS